MKKDKKVASNVLLIMFFISSLATAGSLFFSEVMDFVPCSLCWYQRIFMYPLVLVFLSAILYPDDKVFKYSLPLVLVGLFFAIYHNLLMWKIIPESLVPCKQGIPCSTEYFEYFGFINIPFLSLVAYLSILVILVLYKKNLTKKA